VIPSSVVTEGIEPSKSSNIVEPRNTKSSLENRANYNKTSDSAIQESIESEVDVELVQYKTEYRFKYICLSMLIVPYAILVFLLVLHSLLMLLSRIKCKYLLVISYVLVVVSCTVNILILVDFIYNDEDDYKNGSSVLIDFDVIVQIILFALIMYLIIFPHKLSLFRKQISTKFLIEGFILLNVILILSNSITNYNSTNNFHRYNLVVNSIVTIEILFVCTIAMILTMSMMKNLNLTITSNEYLLTKIVFDNIRNTSQQKKSVSHLRIRLKIFLIAIISMAISKITYFVKVLNIHEVVTIQQIGITWHTMLICLLNFVVLLCLYISIFIPVVKYEGIGKYFPDFGFKKQEPETITDTSTMQVTRESVVDQLGNVNVFSSDIGTRNANLNKYFSLRPVKNKDKSNNKYNSTVRRNDRSRGLFENELSSNEYQQFVQQDLNVGGTKEFYFYRNNPNFNFYDSCNSLPTVQTYSPIPVRGNTIYNCLNIPNTPNKTIAYYNNIRTTDHSESPSKESEAIPKSPYYCPVNTSYASPRTLATRSSRRNPLGGTTLHSLPRDRRPSVCRNRDENSSTLESNLDFKILNCNDELDDIYEEI